MDAKLKKSSVSQFQPVISEHEYVRQFIEARELGANFVPKNDTNQPVSSSPSTPTPYTPEHSCLSGN